ncbi:AAA family ATPase [Dactylosporangium sp. McL0621]|uniref:helix-turn-helix transcriptional regulator n=1 Tax=Dactylosporangium sp. McL0621 TaxID=3415678 RepID=UPI003CF9C870
MTVGDSSWPEHQSLRRRDQAGQPVESRSVVALVGRTDELELIDSLLGGQSRIGRSLLLRGDPGVGKTALLDAAAVRAEAVGMRVLRVSGAEFEAEIEFSALHQLLDPLREHADRLAGHHRDALQRVFDLAPGSSPDPLVITAVLALLREVAAECPVLMIADDVEWIDRASATVLGFAARRFGDDRVSFLAAARAGAGGFVAQVRLPEWELRPLAEEPATMLLDAAWPGLAPAVRRRVLAEAAGNPLVLRELPAALTERQRRGQEPLPTLLPLNRRLQARLASEMQPLPPSTRRLLLLAALEPDASLAVLRTAAQGHADIDDLAPAQEVELMRVDAVTGGVSFSHPLIRSAIVQNSSPGERRAAHQALADALAHEPTLRAWHLAGAATGPDEAVARALEEAALSAWWRRNPPHAEARGGQEGAISARRRRGTSAVVAALMRAAELSPHPAVRSRRLVDAAVFANITGQLDQVPRLLADAGQASDTRSGVVFAVTAYLLSNSEGDLDSAHRLLVRAFDEVTDTAEATDQEANAILYALMVVGIYAARPEPWELLKSALDRFDPEAVTPFRLCLDAFTDPARTSDAVRDGLARAFASLPAHAPPWQVVPLAFAAAAVDAVSDYRHLFREMIDRERADGVIITVVVGLLMLCVDAYVRGHWDEAEELAREGLDLAAAHGYRLLCGQLRFELARIAAHRGNLELAQTLIDEISTWAAPRGIGITNACIRHLRAINALAQGDYEEAYIQAAQIDPPGAMTPGVPGRWAVLDLVEAAVRSGRAHEARAHVAAAQQVGNARISPNTALITAGAAALAADDDEAGALFDAALALPAAARCPFVQARIQLAYGERLRRNRDTARARLYLRAALDTLDGLGAQPWLRRARHELRATGLADTTRPDTQTVSLTAQERQIAELAATGLTNKQIAQRLFLSHRTVGAHLHRLFPKLGITSRSALRDALATITPDENGRAPQPGSHAEDHDGQRSSSARHR